MSGLRVLELEKLLIDKGFDAEEADVGGVAVEDLTSMVMDYNEAMCAGDPLMVATVDGKRINFGTLSHSHLNQLLKNKLASMIIPDEHRNTQDPAFKSVIGPSGCVDLSFMRGRDETFCAIHHRGSVVRGLGRAHGE